MDVMRYFHSVPQYRRLFWILPSLPLCIVLGIAIFCAGCSGDTQSGSCTAITPVPHDRAVPGWSDRDYTIHVPTNYDCSQPTAVILALHGGGGNKDSMYTQATCPDGNQDNPKCLHKLADREGFIVV